MEWWYRARLGIKASLTKWAISLTNDSSLISWKQIFIRLTVAIPSPSSIAVLFASLEQYCIQCIFITLVRILWHDSDYNKKLFGRRCLRMLELANATSSNPFPFFLKIEHRGKFTGNNYEQCTCHTITFNLFSFVLSRWMRPESMMNAHNLARVMELLPCNDTSCRYTFIACFCYNHYDITQSYEWCADEQGTTILFITFRLLCLEWTQWARLYIVVLYIYIVYNV